MCVCWPLVSGTHPGNCISQDEDVNVSVLGHRSSEGAQSQSETCGGEFSPLFSPAVIFSLTFLFVLFCVTHQAVVVCVFPFCLAVFLSTHTHTHPLGSALPQNLFHSLNWLLRHPSPSSPSLI